MLDLWSGLKQLSENISDSLKKLQKRLPNDIDHTKNKLLIDQLATRLENTSNPDQGYMLSLLEVCLSIAELYVAKESFLDFSRPIFNNLISNFSTIFSLIITNKKYCNNRFFEKLCTILHFTSDDAKVSFINDFSIAEENTPSNIFDYFFLIILSFDFKNDPQLKIKNKKLITNDLFRIKLEELLIIVVRAICKISCSKNDLPQEKYNFLLTIDEYKLDFRIKNTSSLFYLFSFLEKIVNMYKEFTHGFAMLLKNFVSSFISTSSPKTSLIIIDSNCIEFEPNHQIDDYFENEIDSKKIFSNQITKNTFLLKIFFLEQISAEVDLIDFLEIINNYYLLGFHLLKEGMFLEEIKTTINNTFFKMLDSIEKPLEMPLFINKLDYKNLDQFLRNTQKFFTSYNQDMINIYKRFLIRFFKEGVIDIFDNVLLRKCESMFDLFLTNDNFVEIEKPFIKFLKCKIVSNICELDALSMKILLTFKIQKERLNFELLLIFLDFLEKLNNKILLLNLAWFLKKLDCFSPEMGLLFSIESEIDDRLKKSRIDNLIFCKALLTKNFNFLSEFDFEFKQNFISENFNFIFESQLNNIILEKGHVFMFDESCVVEPYQKIFNYNNSTDIILCKNNPEMFILQNDSMRISCAMKVKKNKSKENKILNEFLNIQFKTEKKQKKFKVKNDKKVDFCEEKNEFLFDSFEKAFLRQKELFLNNSFRTDLETKTTQNGRVGFLNIENPPINNFFYFIRNLSSKTFEVLNKEIKKTNRFYKINIVLKFGAEKMKEPIDKIKSKMGIKPTMEINEYLTKSGVVLDENYTIHQFSFNQFIIFKDFNIETKQMMLLILTDKSISKSQFAGYFWNNIVLIAKFNQSTCQLKMIKNGNYTKFLECDSLIVPIEIADVYISMIFESTLNQSRIFESVNSKMLTISYDFQESSILKGQN